MPEVYWDHCRVDVLVTERIHGVVISDLAHLRAIGTDFRKLAENGVRIFFTQVFKHNFFHADMHPGNIFVLVEDPANPRYAAVDFGIIGTLDLRDQYYLASNFLAVLDRDYRRVATLHVESGWVPPGTRIAEMESAVRTVCEPIFNKPLKEISYGHVLLRLFEIARRFDMVIQPQLILLQKTLINVEGLGRELYPDLDVWSTAGPVLRAWMRERVGPRAMLHNLRHQWPEMLELVNELPAVVKDAVRHARERRGGVRLEESARPLPGPDPGPGRPAPRGRHRGRRHPPGRADLARPRPGGGLAGLEHAGPGRRLDPGGPRSLDMSTRLR